jgi:hypothetical protein
MTPATAVLQAHLSDLQDRRSARDAAGLLRASRGGAPSRPYLEAESTFRSERAFAFGSISIRSLF